MRTAALASRRTIAQRGLLGTVLAVTFVTSGTLVGLSGYLDSSAAAVAREVLGQAEQSSGAVRVIFRAHADQDAQAHAAGELFDERLEGTAATAHRSLHTFPLVAGIREPSSLDEAATPLTVAADGSDARLRPRSDATIAEHAGLTSGDWPGAGETALHAATAELLGLRVGDTLELGDPGDTVAVQVSGTWLPADASDPYWVGDRGVATGESEPAGDGTRAFGPAVMSESTLRSLPAPATAHWTIVTDASTATPGQLATLHSVLVGLRDDVRNLPGGLGTAAQTDGGLANTVGGILDGLGATRGVTPVGVALVGLLGAITLVQLARLLSMARRPENALLRSRGASALWLTTVALIESVIVGIAGAALGVAAATFALDAAFTGTITRGVPWPWAAAVALVAVAVLTATAARDAARISRRDSVDDSGRARSAATGAAAALTAAAAGVAIWQTLLYGSPLVRGASGQLEVNPLAVLAPALALIASALIVLVLIAPAARLLDRRTAASRTLQPSYSIRQVSRGIASYAVAILVVTLAAGGVTFAASYAGTWNSLSERSAQAVTGADARLDLDEESGPAETLDKLGQVPGVHTATRALTATVRVGDDEAALLALPAAKLTDVLASMDGTVDVGTLADALESAAANGLELPPGTSALSIEVAYESEPTPVEQLPADLRNSASATVITSVWLQDAGGLLARVELGRQLLGGDGASVVATHRSVIPDGDEPWSVVAIDVRSAGIGIDAVTLDVSASVTVGGSESTLDLLAGNWTYALGGPVGSTVHTDASQLKIQSGSEQVRIAPPAVRRVDASRAGAIPVAISAALADRLAIGVGDELTFDWSARTLIVDVVAIVPHVPGTAQPYAILADLTAVTDSLLRSAATVPAANEVWFALDDPDAPIDRELASVTTVADARQNAYPLAAGLSLWIAAAAAMSLATVSLAAIALTIARSRRGEVTVLRAAGVPASAQARARLAELGAVVAGATIIGVVCGLLVSAVTVPALARSIVRGVPQSLPTNFAVEWWSAVLVLGVAGVAMAAIALLYAGRVRAQALDTDERLETR